MLYIFTKILIIYRFRRLQLQRSMKVLSNKDFFKILIIYGFHKLLHFLLEASIFMKRSNDKKKQKQLTLGAFNLLKTITDWNREVSVEIPKIARIEKNYVKCPNCDKFFVNNQ